MVVCFNIMTELKTILCESCEYNGISINAHVWCSDCNGGLFEECIKGHKTTQLLRQHLIIPIEEYIHAENKPDIQMCLKHNKTLEKYCCSHDAVLCIKCVQNDHRFCENLIGFNEAVKNSENAPALLNLEEQIMTTMRHIDFVIDFQKLNKENLKEQEDKIRQEIQKTRDSIISHIDYLHLQLCDDLKATFEKARSACDISKTRLKEIKNYMCQSQQEVTNLKKNVSEKYTFIGRKLIEKNILAQANTVKQDLSYLTKYQVCFQPNPKFKRKYLKKNGFISLHLDMNSSLILEPDMEQTFDTDPDLKCESPTKTGLEYKCATDINLERKSLIEPELKPIYLTKHESKHTSSMNPDWKPTSLKEPDLEQTFFMEPDLEQTSFKKPDLRQTFFAQPKLQHKSSFERIYLGRKYRVGVKPMFKRVNITSAVILQNNKIVLAEQTYKGLIEIILDDSFTMFNEVNANLHAQQCTPTYLKKEVILDDSDIRWIPLTFAPLYMTAIDDDTVALLHYKREIGIVDINTREVKRISGPYTDCEKFVYGDDKFYAITNNRREITEFDMKFSSAKIVVNAQIKRYIDEIAFFEHRIVYCTSEFSDKKINMHCCNQTGKSLWTVTLDLIEKPFSSIPMTLDDQGNVFVAGHIFHLVSADGKHSKVLLDESGQKAVTHTPARLFYEKNANLLISTNNNISVDIFMVRR